MTTGHLEISPLANLYVPEYYLVLAAEISAVSLAALG